MTLEQMLARAREIGQRVAALLAQQTRTDVENTEVDTLTTEAGELAAKITAERARIEAANVARTRLLDLVGIGGPNAPPAPQGDPQQVRTGNGPVPQPRDPQAPERRSIADQLLAATEYRSSAAMLRAGGSGRIGVNVGTPDEAGQGGVSTRALFTTTNNPVNFPRVPGILLPNDQPVTLLDIVDRQDMTSTSIEWVREDAPPQAATEVAEGQIKPEATFTLTLVTDTAATIAHWVNITRQALADDAQMRGYIEGRLTYGLLKRLNAQILNGNGTAPNLRGILFTSGTGTYVAAAAEAALISIRKAKTVAQLSEFDPDSVVMNPVDWERIELSTDSTGAFRLTTNAQAAAAPRVWGLTVVSTTVIAGTVTGTTGGRFVVGNFRQGATLWERQGVTIFITDSHASNFTQNILTLLAEMRAALSIWRPKAFVLGTFGNAGN